MNASGQAETLFLGLVDAAKSMDWRPNADPRIHHRESRGVEENYAWQATQQETLRLVFPEDAIFHLQIRLEQHEVDHRSRVVVFGRQVKTLTHATPNTQRATLNSNHRDESGFWLRPTLDDPEKELVAELLPGPGFPRWDGRHVQLGSDLPYLTLRYFITALAAIERVKGKKAPSLLPFEGEASDRVEFDVRDLSTLEDVEEGRVQQILMARRARCQRLLGEAREHFRRTSPDGRLHCRVCDWAPPLPTRHEAIQIHHTKQLGDYPKEGKRLTLKEALMDLVPLCPNCHRLVESHPNGGCYTIDELIHQLPVQRK